MNAPPFEVFDETNGWREVQGVEDVKIEAGEAVVAPEAAGGWISPTLQHHRVLMTARPRDFKSSMMLRRYIRRLTRRAADARPTPYGVGILAGLQGKHIYQGTVPAGVKADRRRRNKAARAARKAGR